MNELQEFLKYYQRKYSGISTSNSNIVTDFYTALGNSDYESLRELYDISVKYEIINESKDWIHTEWTISYLLEVTGRRVILNEKGFFRIEDGKIVEHRDEYDFWSWSSQGLGFVGKCFGWLNWFKLRVKVQAKRTIDVFMKLNPDFKPEI